MKGKEKISKQSPVFLRVAIFCVGWVLKLFLRYKVINGDAVPKTGAYLLASNHISGSDPIIMVLAQKKRCLHFMAKAELFKNPIIAFVLAKLGAFPVHRGAGDSKAVNLAQELLKMGEAEVIYLEGTRSKDGEFLKPKSGAAMIAYSTNTPVIPVCMTKLSNKNRTIIHFGNIFTPQELGMTTGNSKEFRDASRKIMDEIAKMRQEDLQNFCK
ncbi:MAG: 1-acyl-sn-glycerol-3-phosphate acyltransferase [Oscillospiraceae bacterium]|nr:1-acyl-sn-glycerol-3-phosphate acyltransferase [Oscillospiraceae bacterium]